MFKMSLTTSGTEGTLVLRDSLSIKRAADLKKALIEALDQTDQLQIRVECGESMSLAALQLFCAAHRSAIAKGKQIRLGENLGELFQDTSERAGFTRHMGCSLDKGKTCFWLKGAA